MDPVTLENFALLLLRIVLSLVFLSSGMTHVRDPVKRGESIGFPPAVAFALGALEVMAGLSVALGAIARAGATMMILVMLGAIYKKAFVWKSGFFGEDNGGWYYDLLYAAAALVVLATGGGEWVVF
jgi:putative oxidoreductase